MTRIVLAGVLWAAAGAASAAGVAVPAIDSPGPALRMSGAGGVTGYYIAKCTTLSSQPKRTCCYSAPWVYDGRQLSKLANRFAGNANARAVAVNDAGELIGADVNGAWYHSQGTVAYVDSAAASRGSRLVALNNRGVAAGMSTLSSGYQPINYRFGGVPAPALAPGHGVVDLNDAGMLAGWFANGSGFEQAFVATAAGTAVRPGASAPDGYTALLWTGSADGPLDLNANASFAPAGAWNVHAPDIDDAGTVLTGCNDTSGNFFTCLLHPLPRAALAR